MSDNICNKCNERPIIGGAKMTKYMCNKCSKVDMYHMTCIPKICKDCSIIFNMCRRCCCKIEVKRI